MGFGTPAPAALPVSFEVDYVRLYQVRARARVGVSRVRVTVRVMVRVRVGVRTSRWTTCACTSTRLTTSSPRLLPCTSTPYPSPSLYQDARRGVRLSCDPADHPTAAYIRRNHLDYGVRTDSPGVHLPSPQTEPQPQPAPSPSPNPSPNPHPHPHPTLAPTLTVTLTRSTCPHGSPPSSSVSAA